MAHSKWLVIELSELGETASFEEIANELSQVFCEEYFIPVHHEQMGSYTSTSVLFEGYVFVKDTDKSRQNIDNIMDSHLLAGVLQVRGKYQTVGSKTIGVLKRKLKNSVKKKLKIGTKVQILEGIFKNLTGEIMSIDDGGKKVTVRIRRLSRQMIAPLPSTSVVEIS